MMKIWRNRMIKINKIKNKIKKKDLIWTKTLKVKKYLKF